eukprot:RCo044422
MSLQVGVNPTSSSSSLTGLSSPLDAGYSGEDLANLRYLALHQIPDLLERLTQALALERPARPLEAMARKLGELRVASRTKSIEDGIQVHHGDPNFRLSSETSREIGRQFGTGGPSSVADDSVRSESSATFSVASVDMADFLQEFRQAYAFHSRDRQPSDGRLTKADLGAIIDFVAFPTPDSLLAEMFTEIDVDGEGSVDFEVFLARMSYTIQGRFSTDALKAVVRSVALDNNVLGLAEVGQVLRKLGFRLAEKEVREVTSRYASDLRAVTFEELLRIVHCHAALLHAGAAAGVSREGGSRPLPLLLPETTVE